MKSFSKEIFWVCGLLAMLGPFCFLGLDLTDTGYHFLNQKNLLTNAAVLGNSVYYLLSDFLAGVFLQIFNVTSLAVYRGFGLLVWMLTAMVGFRLLQEMLREIGVEMDSRFQRAILILSLAVSAKPFWQGMLLIPDYYTIPTFFLTVLMWKILKYLRLRSTSDLGWVISICLLLPFLRWPLLLLSLISLVSLIVAVKSLCKFHRGILMAAFVAQIFSIFAYQKWVLKPFAVARELGADYMTQILRLYGRNLGDLSVEVIPLLLIAAVVSGGVARTSLRAWKWQGALLAVLIGLLVQSLWMGEIFYIWFNLKMTLLALAMAGVFAYQQSPQQCLRVFKVLGISLVFIGGSFAGTDVGISKAGYFSFPLLAVGLVISLQKISRLSSRLLLLVGMFVATVCYLYSSVYRDDLSSIQKNPVVLVEPSGGVVITTVETQNLLREFQELVSRPELQQKPILIAPNAPGFYRYLQNPDLRLIWPEIKAPASIQSFLSRNCLENPQALAMIVKRSLTDSLRAPQPLDAETGFLKFWKESCGFKVIAESERWAVLQND